MGGRIVHLGGMPIEELREVIAEEAEAATNALLAAIGTTRSSAGDDGRLLWALAHFCAGPLAREALREAAVTLAEQILDLKAAEGFWTRDYVGNGVARELELACGLGAYGAAIGEEGYCELARAVALRGLERCDGTDYVGASGGGEQAPAGARCLGDWAQILRLCNQLLARQPDRQLQIAAARAVAAMLNYHCDRESLLLHEVVDRDFFPAGGSWNRYVHSGAALAALTGLLDEAARCREERLLHLVARYLRAHLEAAWDVEEGGVRGARAEEWSLAKPVEVQEEALVALAALVEYRGAEWEVEWFGRIHGHVAGIAKSDPLARLRRLVRCEGSLSRLVGRAGRPADWLTGG